MSTAPATPKTSEVCAGEKPTDSAHNGTSASRMARAPATHIAPVPSVSSTCRCCRSTDATLRGGPAPARWWADPVMSGARRTRHEGGGARDAAHGIRGPRAPRGDDEGADERTDEVADAVDSTEGRQRPGPHGDRYGLREVGLAGQPEEGAREADDEDTHEEHDEAAGERRHEHPDGLDEGSDEQGPPLPDARRERTRRQVAQQLTDPHHRHEQGRHPHRGTELACRHGHDRRHGARARRAEQGRAVGGQRDRAQTAAASVHAVLANLGHATGP